MNKSISWLLWATLTGLAAWRMGWFDRFHLVFGGLALVIPVGIALRNTLKDPAGKLRPAVPFLYAVTAVMVLIGLFIVIKATPLRNCMPDYDRAAFMEQLDIDEQNQNQSAAEKKIRDRLVQEDQSTWGTMSAEWRKELVECLCRVLIRRAEVAPDYETKRSLLDEAIQFAKNEGVSADHAQSLRDQVATDAQAETFVVESREKRKWAEAAEGLRAALRRTSTAGDRQQLATELCGVLVEWGKASPLLRDRHVRFQESLYVADQYDVAREPAKSLLAEVERQLAHMTEIDRRVASYEQDRAWDELKALLIVVIDQEPRLEWLRPYDQLYVDVLCREAEAASDVQTKRKLLGEAIEFATTYNLDYIAVEWLQRAIESESLPRELLATVADAIRQLGNSKLNVDFLRTVVDNVPESQWNHSYDKQLFDALIESSNTTTDPTERRGFLAEAVEFGHERNIDIVSAESMLAELDARLAAHEQVLNELNELQSQPDLASYVNRLRDLASQKIDGERFADWDQILHDALLAFANRLDSPEKREAVILDAIGLVRDNRFDARPAESALAHVRDTLRRNENLHALLLQLHRDGVYAELVALLELESRALPRDQWPQPFDRMLVRSYIDWGNQLDDLVARREKYSAALRAVKRFGLDEQEVSELLARVDSEMARQKELSEPRPLQPGTIAAIVRVQWGAYPPLVLLPEIAVQCNGKHVAGLLAKDFRVEVNGHLANVVGVAEIQQEEPLWLLIAMDTSASLNGAPWNAALRGLTKLLKGVYGHDISVRIVSASQPGKSFSNWNKPTPNATASLSTVAPEGSTAILDSVYEALLDLASRTGQLRLVVFSDGKNTVETSVTLAQIVARAQQHNVVVDTIGLRSPELDSATLRRLANETGGVYIKASTPDEVVKQFEIASRRIRRSGYRLVIVSRPSKPNLPDRFALTIRVGGESAVAAATMFDLPEGAVSRHAR